MLGCTVAVGLTLGPMVVARGTLGPAAVVGGTLALEETDWRASGFLTISCALVVGLWVLQQQQQDSGSHTTSYVGPLVSE